MGDLINVLWNGPAKARLFNQELPDLNQDDHRLVESFYAAKGSKISRPDDFVRAKELIIKRILEIRKKLMGGKLRFRERMSLLARLIDLSSVLRSGSFRSNDLQSLSGCARPQKPYVPKHFNGDPGRVPVITTPAWLAGMRDGTSRQLSKYLSLSLYTNITFHGYLAKYVNEIIFVPHISQYIKIVDGDLNVGVPDEIGGTIVIDNFNEDESSNRAPWELACTMIHEAAHVEYYRNNICDPNNNTLAGFNKRAEYYANSMELRFVDMLLSSKMLNDQEKKSVLDWKNTLLSYASN